MPVKACFALKGSEGQEMHAGRSMTGSLLIGVGCWGRHEIGAKVSLQEWNMSAVDMKLPEVQLSL